ncbi:endonuclease V N-glycosylase UV repair enzyme [Sinorhizobium phage phiM9]|uniref:Endonuclease V n=1 Tax=Sinorhizobium phage phiM9 TaxID=1636182 RepID=A0A0F6R5X1_9CAUD|nr:endonuclease V N-glycosylase UV repair enzyme [Sinorhizobium phage phiM9]AKE44740.1 hypothetical protein Sm_phiM9_112 [Sinorhizobium phage phiM9]
MTRINLVPPSELHDKHLRAEYFELPRVFTAVGKLVLKGRTPQHYAHFKEYRFGHGHVSFFYTRLNFLQTRFSLLVHELISRGVNVNRYSIVNSEIPFEWYGVWTPTQQDIDLSRSRINERLEQMGVL